MKKVLQPMTRVILDMDRLSPDERLLADRNGIRGIPAMVLFKKNGEVHRVLRGALSTGELLRHLKSLN